VSEVGRIAHEDVIVKVEDYSPDWEDHTIHIVSPSWMRGAVPSDPERPVFTLHPGEALALIELLAKALQR